MSAENILARLANTIESRKGADAGTSYVAGLMHKGEDAILKKVAEESAETLLAWREHPEHGAAQRRGRERYYQEYTLYACEPFRESRFAR